MQDLEHTYYLKIPGVRTLVSTPEEGFETIQELYERFVREALDENTEFFNEHKDGDDVASTFWFWMENFVVRDLGKVLHD